MFYDFFKRNLILVTALGSLGVGAVGGTVAYAAKELSGESVFVGQETALYPDRLWVQVLAPEVKRKYLVECDLGASVIDGCKIAVHKPDLLGPIERPFFIKHHDRDPRRIVFVLNKEATSFTWPETYAGVHYKGMSVRIVTSPKDLTSPIE